MKNSKYLISETSILRIILATQLILLTYCNFSRIPDRFNHDAATAIRHAVDIWRNGSLFLPDFVSTSTLEIDCATFFAAPIYILTGNLGFSIGVIHVLLSGFVTFLILGLYHNLALPEKYGLLAAILIFTPYVQGETGYADMTFFSAGQYEFRIICMLCLFFLLTYPKQNKIFFLIMGLTTMFFFITSLSTGIYLFGIVLCPFLLYKILEFVECQKFVYRRSERLIFVLCLIAGGGGILLHYMSKPVIVRNSFQLITGEKFVENLLSSLTGIWGLMGGLSEWSSPVFSLHSIAVIINFINTFSIIISVLYIPLKYVNEDKTEKNGSLKNLMKQCKPLLSRVNVIIIVNMLVLMLVDTSYSEKVAYVGSRYHIIWAVALFLSFSACIYIFMESEKNTWKKNAIKILIFTGLICINVGGFSRGMLRGHIDETDMAREIEPFLARSEDNDILFLCSSGEEVTVCKIINALNINSYVYPVVITSDGKPKRNTWGAYDHPDLTQNNILITNKKETERLSKEIMRSYQLISQTENWFIYEGKSNPWSGAGTICEVILP